MILAAGMGFAFVPLTLTVMSGIRREESGLASALLNTGQQVGGAIGLSLLSTVAVTATRNKRASLTTGNGGHLGTHLANVATVHGYDQAFLVAAAIAFAGLILSITVIRMKQPRREEALAVAVA
jgi:MFS family permease